MRPTRTLVVLLLLVLAACGEDKTEVAEKIQTDVVAELAEMAGPEGAGTIAHDGVEVVPDGERYQATVKNLRFLPGEETPLAVGDIVFQIAPKGEDQYDISNLRLPAAITLFAAPDGGGPVKLEIGEQSFAGVWSKTTHGFLAVDAIYRNLELADAKGDAVSLADLTAKGSSTDKGDGLYDRAGSGSAKGLRVTSADGTMTIASMDFSTETQDVKAVELANLRKQWSRLLAAMSEGKAPDRAAVDRLRQYGNWFSGSRARADLAGISFKTPDGTESFALEHFLVEVGASGFDQAKGRFEMTFRNLGLEIPALGADPAAAPYRPLVPSKANIGFALEDLPPAELWAAIVDFVVAGGGARAGDEAALSSAAQVAGFQLLQTLQRAGSSFRIVGWEVESAAARARLDGTVKSDAGSLFGAVASLKAEIAGLDAVVETVQQAMGPDAMSVIGPLEVLRGFANRETGADGKAIDRYAIELAPTGALTINGKPFDAMGVMMGMPGGGPGGMPPAGSSTTAQ